MQENAQRFALAACCHENQPTKRGNVFERKNALKRNVATRQPARDVGRVLQDVFELGVSMIYCIYRWAALCKDIVLQTIPRNIYGRISKLLISKVKSWQHGSVYGSI